VTHVNRFNVKSILLGIGIGIIITSLASIIYLAGRDPLSALSKEEIMAQAEKYGMTRNTETAAEGRNGIFKADTEANGNDK
jgi:hypothetical protein